MSIAIYTLADPDTSDVRYVGQTCNIPHRMACHLYAARKGLTTSATCEWLQPLLTRGMLPIVRVVETVDSDRADDCERKWIEHYAARGCPLVNRSTGGPGGCGVPWSDARRQALRENNPMKNPASRAKLIGRPVTDEFRERMRVLATGHRPSAATRERMSQRMMGTVQSEATCLKRAASLRAVWQRRRDACTEAAK